MGDASINDIATLSGTLFFINLFDIGITAQSHAGTKKPKRIPITEPNTIFLGINDAILSFETYLSIIDEIKDPSNRNGYDSKKIDIKIIDMFFTMSIYTPLNLYLAYKHNIMNV